MSTHASISVLHMDGTVSSVYLHFDGYTEHAGEMLKKHYSTQDKAEELVSNGAICVLSEYVGEQHPFLPATPWGWKEHDELYGRMCAFYHRDRGEKLRINKFGDLTEFMNEAVSEEYDYLFFAGIWMIRKGNQYVRF